MQRSIETWNQICFNDENLHKVGGCNVIMQLIINALMICFLQHGIQRHRVHCVQDSNGNPIAFDIDFHLLSHVHCLRDRLLYLVS